jgi:hypothetical protein
MLDDAAVEVIDKSSTYLSCAPEDLASINLIKILVRLRAPIFRVYC